MRDGCSLLYELGIQMDADNQKFPRKKFLHPPEGLVRRTP